MQQNAKTILFKLIDKIILVALLVVTTLFIMNVYGKKVSIDPHPDFDKIYKEVEDKAVNSKHPWVDLPHDVVVQTVAGFRMPDDVFQANPQIFPTIIIDDRPKDEWGSVRFVWTKDSEPQPVEKKLPFPVQQLLMTIGNPSIVAVENIADKPEMIILKPLAAGKTTVEFSKEGKKVGKIDVEGLFEGPPQTTLTPPKNFTVEAGQGEIIVSWLSAQIENGKITFYRIYKKEADEEPKCILVIPGEPPQMEPPPEGFELKTKLPNGSDGPVIKLKEGKYTFVDKNAVGDTPYSYAIEVAGLDSENKETNAATEPETIKVDERFKIVFTLPVSPMPGMEPEAQVEISVFYQAEGQPGAWVSKKFNVRKGMPVGCVADINQPGKKIKGVNFSTGYRVLDIIPDEPRIKSTTDIKDASGEVIGQREVEGKRHRLLLINERGSIKVLWHELN